MLFHEMRNYWSFVIDQGVRLTNVAYEMNRPAIWTPEHDLAEAENAEADQKLID